MRRILLVFLVLLVGVLTLAIVVPAFAAPGGGADVTTKCFDWTDAADVEGYECDRTVTTPSNNDNINDSKHFTPDEQGYEAGGTVDQGAQHNLGGHCDDLIVDSCNTTYTPSGNSNGTFHRRT